MLGQRFRHLLVIHIYCISHPCFQADVWLHYYQNNNGLDPDPVSDGSFIKMKRSDTFILCQWDIFVTCKTDVSRDHHKCEQSLQKLWKHCSHKAEKPVKSAKLFKGISNIWNIKSVSVKNRNPKLTKT